MYSKIKKLLSHSAIYGLGSTAEKIVGFFLLPIYTRYLTVEDYGILSLCILFSSILVIFLNLGLNVSIFKSYFKVHTENEKNTIITTAGSLILCVSMPIIIFIVLNAPWISYVLLGEAKYEKAILLIAFNTFFLLISKIPLSALRAKEESKKYACFMLFKAISIAVLGVIFVVGFKKGFYGVLLSECITLPLISLLLLPATFRRSSPIFSYREAKELLSFGLPFIGSELAFFILTFSDRYFLKLYSTMHQVGLYSLGYKIGQILWILVWAFQLAWPQFLFANEKLPKARSLYSRTSTYYLCVIAFACLSISMLSKEIIMIMGSPSFIKAYKVVPAIALSQLFYGISFIGSIGILLRKKTIYLTVISIIVGGINLILNYLWIPNHGMIGASIATLISYIVQALMITLISVKYYPIPYEYARIIKITAVSLILYFASLFLKFDNISTYVISKLLLLSLYPIILFTVGFFTQDELSSFYRFFEGGKRVLIKPFLL